MRKVFYTFGLIILLAAGAAWYFITFRIDGVIESRMERAASTALGSRVEVGGVKTDLRNGSMTVERITVANPPGFENPYAVQLNSVEAAVDYQALEVKRVVIENPEFIIEEAGGMTNFGQMMKALEAAPEPQAAEPAGKEPVIVIRHFRINKTRAAFESRSLDKYTDVEVDAIEMNNLEGTPSELAEVIAKEVIGELSSEAGAALLKAQAGKQLDKLNEKVSGTLRGLLGGDKDEKDDQSGDGDG